MTTVAIISARIGSKRLHRKNVLDFCGHPLIAWTIIQARACPEIDFVYVTTDSDEIAEVSRQYGASVLMREDPRESCDETGGGVPQAFAALRLEQVYPGVDCFVSMFPTSPLRKPTDMSRIIQAYRKERGDYTFQVPVKDALIGKKIDEIHFIQTIQSKRQNYLIDSGLGGAMRPEYFHEKHEGPCTFVDWDDPTTWQEQPYYEPDPHIRYYVLVEGWQANEIDYQWDFDICEYLFKKYLLHEWKHYYKLLKKD